jgi:hypothetical protein
MNLTFPVHNEIERITMTTSIHPTVFQFKITLTEIEPAIWRRIQVPAAFSFWDLHVAIQDAMGWMDYHLHAFRFRPKHKRKDIVIGIPGEDWGDEKTQAGWDIPIVRYVGDIGQPIGYEYDFGDGWVHEVMFEGVLLREKDKTFPRCIAGERACPPEDCGGVGGYFELLEILHSPNHPAYEERAEWLKGHVKCYFPFEADKFEPDQVVFSDPRKRLKMLLSDE